MGVANKVFDKSPERKGYIISLDLDPPDNCDIGNEGFQTELEAPSYDEVLSAGSDAQVMLYKFSRDAYGSTDDKFSIEVMKKWVYVSYVSAHTHDVKALIVAVPINREDMLPDEKVKRVRGRDNPLDFSYHKWAHLGVPMRISFSDDTKLFAYSANEFTQLSPHVVCPAPQKPLIQLVLDTVFNQTPLFLVQASYWLNILCVRAKTNVDPDMSSGPFGGNATTDLVIRVKSKGTQKIICSTMSNLGVFFAYYDLVKPKFLKLRKSEAGRSAWTVKNMKLPLKLPFAHSMISNSDSLRLMIVGNDRRIYVVDVESLKLIHTFTPLRKEIDEGMPPSEPPITRIFTSSDG